MYSPDQLPEPREQTTEDVKGIQCSQCCAPDAYTVESVDEAITVGQNTVLVTVNAAVCYTCG